VREQHRGRHRHDRLRDEVAEHALELFAEHRRVDDHHRPGDGRHASGHDEQQLVARHALEVRSYEEGRLGLAEEDVGGGDEAGRAARAERALEQPGDAADDHRQDAPVPEQRRQRGHHDHERQHLEGEGDDRVRVGDGEGRVAAAEIAEHERAALERGGAERTHRLVHVEQTVLDQRRLEQQQADDELQHDGDADQLPVDAADVARHRQHEGDEDGDAEQRL
jgi:hypothetical protein